MQKLCSLPVGTRIVLTRFPGEPEEKSFTGKIVGYYEQAWSSFYGNAIFESDHPSYLLHPASGYDGNDIPNRYFITDEYFEHPCFDAICKVIDSEIISVEELI